MSRSEQSIEGRVLAHLAALRRGDRPDLLDGLPPGPVRLPALAELVHAELEFRLKAGEPARAADYLERYPELADTPHIRKDLEAAEARFRPADTPVAFPADTPDADGTTEGRPVPADRYELLEMIGAGGMGEVWKARQPGLNRVVALKLVLGGGRADPKAVIRFLAEAEAAAAVRHPHVVQVYEYGRRDGHPFLALEFVPGGTLAESLRKSGRLEPRAAAELLGKVSAGVAAAHAAGVVHRDLKPGNVLLDENGEPKVADFGLARLGAGKDLTATGAVVGTPAYMAPEQAGGGAKFVGPAADVWALGVVLYECLTGRVPFAGADVWAVLRAVREDDPTPPRKVRPGVPRDLELVCLRCLSKGPADRYPTAAELAADLGRFAAGEPVSVRAAGVAERAIKWARRKPTAAAAWGFSSLAVLLAVVVFVVLGFWRDAEGARQTAEAATAQADAAKDDAVRLRDAADRARRGEEEAKKEAQHQREMLARANYGNTVETAYSLLGRGKVVEGRLLLARTEPTLRGWEYDYVSHACQSDLTPHFRPGGLFGWAVWSPDGGKFITSSNAAVTGGKGWVGIVRDSNTGDVLAELKGHAAALTGASWSPDGSQVVTIGSDKTARVWKVATKELLGEFRGHTDELFHVAWSPDGSKIFTAGNDGIPRAWESTTRKALSELKGLEAGLIAAMWNPDGSKLLTAEGGGVVRVWEADTGKPLARAQGRAAPGRCAAWVSGRPLSVTTGSGEVFARVVDVTSGKVVKEFKHYGGGIDSADWSPDGSKVLITSPNGCSVWDSGTCLLLAEHRRAGRIIGSSAWSPDGSRVVSVGGGDGPRAWVWDPLTGQVLAEAHSDPGRVSPGDVRSATWHPDGTRILLADVNHASVWAVPIDRTSIFSRDPPNCAAWNSDGSKLLVAGQQTLQVRDVASGRVLTDLFGGLRSARHAAWGPGDSKILVVGWGGPARVWDAATGTLLRELGGGSPVTSASWNSDGSQVLAACGNGGVKVFEVGSGRVLRELRVPGAAMVASWDPGGSRILAVCWDGKTTAVRILDAVTGRGMVELEGHAGRVDAACWSPDGAKVVTASDDTTARVWDPRSGRTLAEFKGHTGPVQSISWKADGSRVVTTGVDQTARIWDPVSGAELLALPNAYFASFSPDGTRLVTGMSLIQAVAIYHGKPAGAGRARSPVAPAPRAIEG